MKRWQNIVVFLSVCLALWLWSYTQISLNSWLSIPAGVVILVGLYAAYDIFGSILSIKSYPE